MSIEFPEKRVWVASQDVVSTPLGDEVALLDFRSNTYFTLNVTGAFLWSQLQQPSSVADLEQALAQEFDTGRDEVLEDVRTLLDTLHEKRLIAPVNDDAD